MLHQAELAAAGPRPLLSTPQPLKRKAGEFEELPRFHRGYGWSNDTTSMSPSILHTLVADPLPRPPPHLVNDPIIQAALRQHAHNIKVDTPIDVDMFESLLSEHPNQPFVQSVLTGLREGF